VACSITTAAPGSASERYGLFTENGTVYVECQIRATSNNPKDLKVYEHEKLEKRWTSIAIFLARSRPHGTSTAS